MLSVVHNSRDNLQFIMLEGVLIYTEVANLRHQLLHIITHESPLMIINLSKLNYADARGLSVFASVALAAKKLNGEVILLNINSNLRTMIELTRLHHSINIFNDESAAIAEFQRNYHI
jgi:anti-sigma B factor antagonist